MRIDQLPRLTSIASTDEFLVQRGADSYRSPASSLPVNLVTRIRSGSLQSSGIEGYLSGTGFTSIGEIYVFAHASNGMVRIDFKGKINVTDTGKYVFIKSSTINNALYQGGIATVSPISNVKCGYMYVYRNGILLTDIEHYSISMADDSYTYNETTYTGWGFWHRRSGGSYATTLTTDYLQEGDVVTGFFYAKN